MSSDSKLFRSEVVDAANQQAFGGVTLIYPVSNYVLLAGALILIIVFVLFSIFASYTRHTSVPGVLEPTQGVVKVYGTQSGVLRALLVGEGQSVRKGDILFVFETEHRASNGKVVESELSEKLIERVSTLRNELGGTVQLHEASVTTLRRKLAALESNRSTLQDEIRIQEKRLRLSEDTLTRHQSLHESGFLSQAQLQQKLDDLMDQQLRLQSLQKAAISADAELSNMRLELKHSPLREQIAKAQIDRNISTAEFELRKQQSDHEWSVVAPCDGIVTSLTISDGQSAGIGIPLVSIIPSNSQLQANLYAPSRALGFLQSGQLVKIKLDAFPYQKFGLTEGRVVSISESPVRPSEISPGTRLGINAEVGEPMYTVKIQLEKQFIEAYGKRQRLRPGMQLNAEIQLDTRALYEWVLEPLYSLRRS